MGARKHPHLWISPGGVAIPLSAYLVASVQTITERKYHLFECLNLDIEKCVIGQIVNFQHSNSTHVMSTTAANAGRGELTVKRCDQIFHLKKPCIISMGIFHTSESWYPIEKNQ